MSNNAVVLESFTKKYNSKTACSGINLTARENSITGLLGPNGAGKSTILKVISGVLYPTGGTVTVAGEESPDAIRKIVGYVPEQPELDGSLTVLETIILEAKLYCDSTVASENAEYAIKICDLDGVRASKVRSLSKGYRQRVSLAKAICIKPKILILDEFSGGLDPQQIVQLRKRIKKLSSETTVIFSTHHIDEAASMCDYIYIIKDGKVASDGTIAEITSKWNSKDLEEAYIKVMEGGDN